MSKRITIKGGPPFLNSGGIGPDDYLLKPIKGGRWTLVIIRAGRHWQGKEVRREKARAMYDADMAAMKAMFPIQQICVPDMARRLARMKKRGDVPTMSMAEFYQKYHN